MRQRYWVLFWISVTLGCHALIVSRMIPSTFFVVTFCWGWMAVTALSGRLAAAKDMAVTMTALTLLFAIFLKATPPGAGDMTAFFTLAMLPSIVAWPCVYAYLRYLEAEPLRESERPLDHWFETAAAARRHDAVSLEAEAFVKSMTAQQAPAPEVTRAA